MQTLLQELRTILENERALYGAFVSLPEDPRDEPAEVGDLPRPETSSSMIESEAMPTSNDSSPTPARISDAMTGKTVGGGGGRDLSPYARIHALISEASPLHSLRTLDEVEAYVRDTILIPLDETRKNPVFGVGSPTADIMVIGEAPGADEDEKGEPFVGRAGQLLTKILEAIHFKREEVYIANILKSRPPNNRDPLPAEVEAHVPILYKQIALIQPKLILCVGRTSGTTLLNKQTTLGALRQKFHDLHGLPVLVTYHPAALLRNPNWKRPTWEDVLLLRKRYDELVETAEVV